MATNSCIRIADMNEDIFQRLKDENLDFFEYSRIPKNKKLSYLINRTKQIEENDKNITFCVKRNDEVECVWVISKDEFDSQIFGIDIYRVVNLFMLEPRIQEWEAILTESLMHLRKTVSARKRRSYFLIGLNTNLVDTPFIMNELVRKGFSYIHTLLTFKMSRDECLSPQPMRHDNFQIRVANESDVDDVAALAYKSFKYSRFHLDPFLDKGKANSLLATSAKNSILYGYADIMFVAEIEHKVVGYYSAKKKYIPEFGFTFGEAIISAVDERYRGLGIFRGLNGKLLEWFSRNTEIAEMGTYIANTPIHKTWSNNRLSIVRGVHQLATQFDP